MLNDCIVDKEMLGSISGYRESMRYKVWGLHHIHVPWSIRGPFSSVISGVTGHQHNFLALGPDTIVSMSEAGTQFCTSSVAGCVTPGLRVHEPHSSTHHQWYPSSERLVSVAVAKDDSPMPRQRIARKWSAWRGLKATWVLPTHKMFTRQLHWPQNLGL